MSLENEVPKRIELSEEQRECLLNQDYLPDSLDVNGKTYVPDKPVASGYKSAVWKVRDEHGRLRAMKLSIYEDYVVRSYLQELSRAAELEPYREFAHFIDAGIKQIKIGPLPSQKFVIFIEEWIEGLTLYEFVIQKTDLVTASFLLAYVKDICSVLNILMKLGLKHDDFHAKNVMLAAPSEGDLFGEWSIKIIDTGSMKPIAQETGKAKDDHRYFVDHIIWIWNTIYHHRTLSIGDRLFLDEAQKLLQSMLDDDPSIGLREPAQIYEQFGLAYTRASSHRRDITVAPTSPFEFISAEHIADDRLLVDMFARSYPFLDKVDGPDPCLVTGPRGCGKSTMFRWLSLKAHLHKPSEEIDTFRISGFYVSCSSDLQNKLGWIRTEALADKFRREIVHYFNLLLAREVFQTLTLIANRDDRNSFWGFGLTQEEEICNFLQKALAPSVRPRIQGVSRLAQMTEAIESEMFSTHAQMLRGLSLAVPTGDAFLGDLTSHLSQQIVFFKSKRITFLIDDFSSHRLPDPVQIILNRIIWERRPTHVFKLSSEKYGAVLKDTLGATIDVSREMVEIDCGREYIALDDQDQVERSKTFAIELLDNRLKAAGYLGTTMTLIGVSEWDEGSLGRALAEKQAGRSNDQYHGIDCIAGICSGDVSTLLLVYRKIFEKGGVKQNTTSLVSKSDQHAAIVSTSRELFEAIKRHFPYGPEMYDVVAAFGNLVRNILQHGRWINKGITSVPPMCPRIELDQKEGAAIETLTQEQQQLARELVRRAIFIEMEPGLSRHRNVTTLRWHLRRVYLPTFNAALSKNTAVKESVEWLRFLLTDSKGACDSIWKKWQKAQGESESVTSAEPPPGPSLF